MCNSAGNRPALGPQREKDKAVPRPFWKGYLKLSLVTCAVELRPATSEAERVRFHTLNEKTGNRVISRYVDQESKKPVRDQDQAKGFEKAEGDYIILEDEELEAVALESTRTIDIDRFVPRDSIGWIWYDKPHFLSPADKIGAEAFAVIREAMDSAEVSGLARLVMYRRERAVLLEPRDKGIVLWTLRYGDEVRDANDYFSKVDADKPEKKMLTMVRSLIQQRTQDWDEELLTDPVQRNLKRMIAAKKKKSKPRAQTKRETKAPRGGNVIDIMEALRKSLEKEGKA
jgi:DNA end-binding protein Ku